MNEKPTGSRAEKDKLDRPLKRERTAGTFFLPMSRETAGKVGIGLATLFGVSGVTLSTIFSKQGGLINDGRPTVWLLILIALSLALLTFLVMNYHWRATYLKLQETQRDLENYRSRLASAVEESYTDVITGIPNDAMLRLDFKDYFLRGGRGDKGQFILIDISSFRQINKRHGYLLGDQLLRIIAEEIRRTMRREENIYKRMHERVKDLTLKTELYRKYPGGDEFIMLIEGDQEAGLGFVTRLERTFTTISSRFSRLTGKEENLKFIASITEFKREDTKRDFLEFWADKVEACHVHAVEGRNGLRIAWFPYSQEKYELAKASSLDRETRDAYAIAIRTFTKSSIRER